MTEFEFTLKFSSPKNAPIEDDLIEALWAAGCDDALVGTGQAGRIALEFTREANSSFDAISSAIADVKAAIPGAQLVEASPDLAGPDQW